jgi:hypothetical protein
MDRRPLTCEEVEDLVALYVIDALSDDEAAAVTEHLATCPEPHPSIAELAPLAPALALAADPVDAPPALRGRVLDAIAATPQVPDRLPASAPPVVPDNAASQAARTATSALDRAPAPPAAQAQTTAPGRAPAPPAQPSAPGRAPAPPPVVRPSLLERLFGGGSRGWVAAAAIGLVLVLVGVGIATTIGQRTDQSGRLALLADAVQAAASGEATVATLTGSGPAEGAAGYAVLREDEPAFIVVNGLPPVASDEAYQAWFIADGAPVSAGLLELTDDGLGTLTDLEALPGTKVVALTIEERPGVDAPTSDPVVVGELPASA